MNTLRDFLAFMAELFDELRYRLRTATWRSFVDWWTAGSNIVRLAVLVWAIGYLIWV